MASVVLTASRASSPTASRLTPDGQRLVGSAASPDECTVPNCWSIGTPHVSGVLNQILTRTPACPISSGLVKPEDAAGLEALAAQPPLLSFLAFRATVAASRRTAAAVP